MKNHWFACLVYRPAHLGGPAACDCEAGRTNPRQRARRAYRGRPVPVPRLNRRPLGYSAGGVWIVFDEPQWFAQILRRGSR